MKDHSRPTSNWEHSHVLEHLDVLIDTETGDRLRVDKVHDDGGVTFYDMTNGGTETYTELEVRDSLRDEIFETADGLSHELATY